MKVTQANPADSSPETLPEGYRMTELGPLPEEWQVARLGDLATFESGKRPKGGALSQGEVWSLGGEHITEQGNIDFARAPKYVSLKFYQAMRTGKLQQGDTLIVKDGARSGKATFVMALSHKRIAVNEHVFIVRSKDRSILWPGFLGLWIYTGSYWRQIREAYHGLIGGINRKDLASFILPLPPLSEQRAIAHVLRTAQGSKEATEQVIAALKELKKSLMRHLFTYGPVPVDQTDRVELRETEIGPLPRHWKVVRLREVVRKTSKIDPRKKPDQPFKYIDVSSVDNERLVITGYQILYGKNAPSRARKQVEVGDIIFAIVRPYLKRIARIPPELHGQVCSTAFTVLRPQQSTINDGFLFYAVAYDPFVSRVSEHQRGSNYPAITDKDVLAEPIPLPPLSEQREITRILQAVDRKIEAEKNRKEALEALFKSLLHDLMTARRRLPKDYVRLFEEEERPA